MDNEFHQNELYNRFKCDSGSRFVYVLWNEDTDTNAKVIKYCPDRLFMMIGKFHKRNPEKNAPNSVQSINIIPCELSSSTVATNHRVK